MHKVFLAAVVAVAGFSSAALAEGKKIGVTCVFSREAVAPPDASCNIQGDGTLNCHGYGSVVAVTATFGQCAAGWVLDKLATASRLDSKKTL